MLNSAKIISELEVASLTLVEKRCEVIAIILYMSGLGMIFKLIHFSGELQLALLCL